MMIREERESEFPAIYRLVETAFRTAKVSDGTEQDFVDRLRASGNYLPALALVAEEGGELIGHVMLTATEIDADGEKRGALMLAPLCVALEHRGRGVGAALVEESFRRARALGHGSVFLVGDPAYYGRFGFVPASEFGITYALDIPPQFVLGCELFPGALSGCAGVLSIPH